MKPSQTRSTSLACVLTALLASCGGGEGDGIGGAVAAGGGSGAATTVAATLTSPERLSAFVSGYNTGLGALATSAGLTSSAFADLYDERFLDSGQTKQQLRDSLSQEAEATAGGSVQPVAAFPAVSLADAAVSKCDESSGICTLTATVVNSDVDTTRATITTQVRFSDGKFRLYGDQQVASI